MLSPFLVAILALAQAGGTASDWKPFTSAKGKFTVSLPAKPSEKKRVLAVSGKTVDLVSMTARKGLATYTVSYAELAGADAPAALKVAQADLVTQSKGDLKDEKEITLGEFPGKDVTIDIPKKVMAGGATETARVYVVAGRLYELVAVVPAAKADSLTEEVNSFLDSFKPAGVTLAAPSDTLKTQGANAATSKTPAAKPGPAAPLPANPGGAVLGGLSALNPFAGRGSPAMPAPAPAALAPAAAPRPAGMANGVEFKAPDGSFSITAPAALVAKDLSKLPGVPVNAKINGLFYQLVHDKKAFTVLTAEIPPDAVGKIPVPTMLASGRDNAVKVSSSTLVRSQPITLNGVEGIEFVLTSNKIDHAQGGVGISRMYADVRNKRLYILSVAGSTGVDEDKTVKAFLDSFHILGAAANK